MMDIIEKIYERNKSFVQNDNFAGVKGIIVDNYSDEAHFIYELLQNADDANASEITFELLDDKLVVSHNGIPFTEENLKAICSIKKGTKSDDYTKIGRFGIGFKSVFVYTEAPQIFSGKYQFEIRELILPREIHSDCAFDKNKTVFILPFNARKTKKIAWKQIYEKLVDLNYDAILFLKNIKHIQILIENTTIKIDKTYVKKYEFNRDEEFEHAIITVGDPDNEDDIDVSQYYIVKKNGISLVDVDDDGKQIKVPNQSVMLAYLVVDTKVCALSDDPVYEYSPTYYVFFPTRIPSNSEFLIHAPFVTKSSRETFALNNAANNELLRNIGELIADSMIVLSEEGQLTVDLMENLFFDGNIAPFSDKLVRESFNEEYSKLIREGRHIIPCVEGFYEDLNTTLFTSEPNEISEKLMSLLESEWLKKHYGLAAEPRLCYVNEDSSYYDYMSKLFRCRKLILEEIAQSLTAEFYESRQSEWFKDYCELLLRKNYYSKYAARFDNLDKLPLIRTKGGRHLSRFNAANVYMNNDTLDPVVLSSEPIRYLYIHVFNIKDYSSELNDALDAMSLIKEQGSSDFEIHLALLRKIYIAIDNKKLTSKDIEREPIIYVINQKTKASRFAPPNDALIGLWEKNGSFDLYSLCVGADIELIDKRYMESFTVQELKKLGIKGDGLRNSDGNLMDFYRYNRVKTNAYCAPHVRPLQGKANNRLFNPLFQFELFDSILDAPMTIEKSIIILRLAKEFDTQIKDWVEWSSRKDFSPSAQYNGYDECYSIFGYSLISKAWMYDINHELKKPGEISADYLQHEYRRIMTSDIADKLGMRKSYSEKLDTVNQRLQSDGFFAVPLSEKEAYEDFKRQRAARLIEAEKSFEYEENNILASDVRVDFEQPGSTGFNLSESSNDDESNPSAKVINEIASRTQKKVSYRPVNPIYLDDETDSDEYMPSPVNYSKKIERAKEQSAAEIDKITFLQELQAIVDISPRYSYAWFKALLEMESISSGESNRNSKEVTISFAKVEPEPNTQRTLVLKHPDRYIPQFMEELADIPLILNMGGQEKRVEIEVINIRSYTLRVKLKDVSALENLNLEDVSVATIKARSPAFLMDELKEQFSALGYDDNYDMKQHLCENIDFIFGPPGTGKTTHLARNVLYPMMQSTENCKVLVLAPTNKAADVLVRRVIEVSDPDKSYAEWLIRFGSATDEVIEQSGICTDKMLDIRKLSKSITVTTIARFPYDYYMPVGDRLYLRDINWDYIIIDEASMIPLINIVLPLYLKTPHKFIIAGDPFQIQPITSVDIWKNENIYTMVELNSFVHPKPVPHPYHVELLTTQYRSIPDIGAIFSQFSYGGILSHYRENQSQRPLNVGNDLGIETLNIIKFPVSKYESIYRCKRLQHSSSYQIYSALFTYEYVQYLSKAISANNPGKNFSIGVIAPYRTQADLIDKLVSSEVLPKNVNVQVGTIHGFQGDECDIIFAVFNCPPKISTSNEMFLNNRNIINVSISRARDYLFIVMPDDATEDIQNLRRIQRVEQLIKNTDVWQEFLTHDLEELMFGDPNYLENNAFSTSHQSVNVYGLPEKCYEIRTEESAVDIQVHKGVS